MDSDFLHLFATNLSYDGIILSNEQKAALETSLKVLKDEMKFKTLYFWGKLYTMGAPYYIVQGMEEPFNPAAKRTLFSQDCINWALINPPTDQMKKDVKRCKGLLTGQLSFNMDEQEEENDEDEKDIVDDSLSGSADKENEEPNELFNMDSVTMKEEDKLTSLVNWIDFETSLIPRGAYTRTVSGTVIVNNLFTGLSFAEAGKMYNYRHFRPAVRLLEKSILQRADFDQAIDFLDPIVEDVPSEISWSLQYERGGSIVTVKSLLWPGYVFYHMPNTRFYGSLYFGNGIKNLDLPFML